jgi:hypothetical protein
MAMTADGQPTVAATTNPGVGMVGAGGDREPIMTRRIDEPVRLARGPRGRRSTSRRARNVAAAWLLRAERWIRSSELEADRLEAPRPGVLPGSHQFG